jgi:hypothetical protein
MRPDEAHTHLTRTGRTDLPRLVRPLGLDGCFGDSRVAAQWEIRLYPGRWMPSESSIHVSGALRASFAHLEPAAGVLAAAGGRGG